MGSKRIGPWAGVSARAPVASATPMARARVVLVMTVPFSDGVRSCSGGAWPWPPADHGGGPLPFDEVGVTVPRVDTPTVPRGGCQGRFSARARRFGSRGAWFGRPDIRRTAVLHPYAASRQAGVLRPGFARTVRGQKHRARPAATGPHAGWRCSASGSRSWWQLAVACPGSGRFCSDNRRAFRSSCPRSRLGKGVVLDRTRFMRFPNGQSEIATSMYCRYCRMMTLPFRRGRVLRLPPGCTPTGLASAPAWRLRLPANCAAAGYGAAPGR